MIKQGNSDTYPEMIVISNDLYQIRYNIHEVIKEDKLKGKHTSYDYDYIEVDEINEFSKTVIDRELKRNGIEKDEDRKKIRESIFVEIEKNHPKEITKLRDKIK